MLGRARKTIKKFDFNQRYPPSGCKNPVLSLRMVHKLTRASVTQRLDLIRIRLLRSQLEELYKIKNLLELRIDEQRKLEEQQRALWQIQLEEENRRLEELASNREAAEEAAKNEAATAPAVDCDRQRQRLNNNITANQTMLKESIMEDEENVSPLIYYTPEKDKTDRKEGFGCTTIEEEDRDDDLIPVIKATPPRSYPRQSIGQWSVERAKNNMSVRSLVTSLEVKVGPKGSSTRTRAQK